MRVALIYPPFLIENHAFPPLSLPSLAAVLRTHGHEVWQSDLNIAYYRFLGTAEGLSRLERRLASVVDGMARAGGPTGLYERKRFCVASDLCHVWLPFVQGELRKSGYDLSVLPPRTRKVLMERLTAAATIESEGERELLELPTSAILERIAGQEHTLLSQYLRAQYIPGILAFQPDVVGISLMTEDQLHATFTLARALKQAAPGVHIVLGGGLISAVADKIAASSGDLFQLVDSCVAFDGDRAILDIVGCVERGEALPPLPNVISLDRETARPRYTKPVESGPLDQLPLPDFAGLDLGLYSWRIVPYFMTKGCSFGQCTYCSDPAYSTPRNKTPRHAADEIETLARRHGAGTILFVDAYIHPQLLEGVATELIARSVGVKWLTQTRMDRFLTTERIELFARSGCQELWFGMETVNERLTRLIRKGTKPEIIRRILRDCEANGIKVTLNIMIGFPNETEEEADETFKFVSDVASEYPKLNFKCNTGFVYVPRLSAFGQRPESFGIEILEEFEWSPRIEWVAPAWRYKERFRRLEGSVFKRFYGPTAGAGGAADRRTPPFADSSDTRVRVREHVYVRSLPFDPAAMWQAVLRDEDRLVTLQRETKWHRRDAVRALDAAGDGAGAPAAAADSIPWAYVVDDRLNRRLVRLSPFHQRLLSEIGGGCDVAELIERCNAIYGRSNGDRLDGIVRESLGYLARGQVVEVSSGAEEEARGAAQFVLAGEVAAAAEPGVSVW